jgi:hypothetical protein
MTSAEDRHFGATFAGIDGRWVSRFVTWRCSSSGPYRECGADGTDTGTTLEGRGTGSADFERK